MVAGTGFGMSPSSHLHVPYLTCAIQHREYSCTCESNTNVGFPDRAAAVPTSTLGKTSAMMLDPVCVLYLSMECRSNSYVVLIH